MCIKRWTRAGPRALKPTAKREGLPGWVLALLVFAGLAVLWWWQCRRRQPALYPTWPIYPADVPSREGTTPAGSAGVARAGIEPPPPAGEVARPTAPPIPTTPAGPAARVPEGETAAAPGDDLTLIEGIGSKIAGLLHSAGITTYAELGAADEGHLKGLLSTAKLWMIDPGTWPEQARLAAAGDWHALKVLKAQIKARRRRTG
jgi:predicted flap endonuclease-1-like 5' DNA nuclease